MTLQRLFNMNNIAKKVIAYRLGSYLWYLRFTRMKPLLSWGNLRKLCSPTGPLFCAPLGALSEWTENLPLLLFVRFTEF